MAEQSLLGGSGVRDTGAALLSPLLVPREEWEAEVKASWITAQAPAKWGWGGVPEGHQTQVCKQGNASSEGQRGECCGPLLGTESLELSKLTAKAGPVRVKVLRHDWEPRIPDARRPGEGSFCAGVQLSWGWWPES